MEKSYTLSPQTLEAIRRIVEDSNKASSSEDLRQQVFLLVTALRLFQRDMDRERKYIDAMSDSRRREIEQDALMGKLSGDYTLLQGSALQLRVRLLQKVPSENIPALPVRPQVDSIDQFTKAMERALEKLR